MRRGIKRPYSASDFEFLVQEARRAFPDMTISTDIIIGFPGETSDEFNETMRLIERTRPDITNISKFSARPNTEAAKMPNQVSGPIKKERSRAVSRLCRRIEAESNSALAGREELILVNEPGAKGNYVGRTSGYKSVVIKENLLGRFAKVRLLKSFPTYLSGETTGNVL